MTFDLTQILIAVVTAIVSIVGTIIAFWTKGKELDTSGSVAAMNSLIAQSTDLRIALKTSDEQNNKLRHELGIIRGDLEDLKKILQTYENNPINKSARSILEVLVNQFDFPVWVCDVESGSWYINDSFSKHYNVQRTNFWTPIKIFELFETSDAAGHQECNLRAIRFGAPLLTKELFLDDMMDKESDFNKKEEWFVLRIPVLGTNNFLIILSSKDIKDCIFKKYA